MERARGELGAREVARPGYVRVAAAVRVQHVLLVVANAQQHLTHVHAGGEEARGDDDHVDVGEERVDDGVELRVGVQTAAAGEGRYIITNKSIQNIR